MLVAGFPDQKWTDETQDVYQSSLEDLSFDTARKAVRRLMACSKFRPSISEVRSMCVDIELGTKRTGIEAWGDVLMAIRIFGSYRTPKFEDPLVAEAVRQLGWRNLCLGDAGEASDRARFAEAYDTLVDRQRADAVAGFALPPPSLNRLSSAQQAKSLPEWEETKDGGHS